MKKKKKKGLRQLDSGSGDQITYQEGTSYEVAPLWARNSVSTSELGMWEHMGQRSDSLLG